MNSYNGRINLCKSNINRINNINLKVGDMLSQTSDVEELSPYSLCSRTAIRKQQCGCVCSKHLLCCDLAGGLTTQRKRHQQHKANPSGF